ncbi:hypothetical protein BDY21DRAFT_294145 [Lineolata rhizophorae]|uniref:Zn(2)-C6 fungal-type domain-containing protein n=1 Tax=Lineolata rhizophorae TaxID=578093 RepID=A0A6A6NMR3_9PEZI|nr:hypothetical protein BDY21DRAFT_294145 [Lineolata rhizophorae]
MFRRNGKPKSCEPCRISKIRCDHTSPTCLKCSSRGMVDRCYYHAAPMTKPRTKEQKRAVISPMTPSDTPSVEWEQLAPGPIGNQTQPGETVHSGYLGATSYASIFQEDMYDRLRLNAQLAHIPNSTAEGVDPYASYRFEVEAKIIARLFPHSLLESLVKAYYDRGVFNISIAPLVIPAIPKVWDYIDRQLEKHGGRIDFSLPRKLNENTARPFKVPPDTSPSDFLHLFTGENLRWEFIGLIFALAGVGALACREPEANFTVDGGRQLPRNEFVGETITAAEVCLDIFRRHGETNDLSIMLVKQLTYTESNYYGDSNAKVWRGLGECSTEMFALGMHRTPDDDPSMPFFLKETRKRVFAAAFRSDKILCTFLGRPPRIPYRYCDFMMPLDLSDDDLVAEGEQLERALAQLDSDGWDRRPNRKVHSSSWVRMRYLMSIVREDVLELSLAAGKKDLNIHERLNLDTWNTFPQILRYTSDSWTKRPPAECSMLLIVYLEHLHTSFSIERLRRRVLCKQAAPSARECPTELLRISLKLVQTTLDLIRHSHGLSEVRRNFAWILLFYGLAPAGVLATELRRTTMGTYPFPATVCRAELIRNLCVLVSCLEWVAVPGTCNYKLCYQVSGALKDIVDQALGCKYISGEPSTLDPDAAAESSTTARLANGNSHEIAGVPNGAIEKDISDDRHTFGDFGEFDASQVPMETEDFLNWLENMEWDNMPAS